MTVSKKKTRRVRVGKSSPGFLASLAREEESESREDNRWERR